MTSAESPAPDVAAEPPWTPDPGDWGIIGHQSVVDRLAHGFGEGGLAHALLLTGPAGVGRLPLARSLARLVNCEGDPAPCYTCGPCRRLTHGTFVGFQVLEIQSDDGKLRQGVSVQQVRDLCDDALLPPLDGRLKVFVIREAELLTGGAANALLKTLEEPPPHALLVLLAPSPGAVLPTIGSRCAVLRLASVSRDELVVGLIARGIPEAEAIEAAAGAGGLPGVALALATDPAARERRARAGQWLDLVVRGDLVDRFGVADQLGELWNSDRSGAREMLAAWTIDLERVLQSAGPHGPGVDLNPSLQGLKLSEAAAVLRSLQALPDRLDHMQPRNALDAFMLDVEEATGRVGGRRS